MRPPKEQFKEKNGIILVPMNNPIHYIAIKDEVDKPEKFSLQINNAVQNGPENNQSQSD
jgi:hypothetical protein